MKERKKAYLSRKSTYDMEGKKTMRDMSTRKDALDLDELLTELRKPVLRR